MTPSTLCRLNDPILQDRLSAISRKYGPDADDVRQHMTLALIEKSRSDPSFAEQSIGYWIRRASWEAKHFGEKAAVYNRFVEVEPYVTGEDGESVSFFDELIEAPGPNVEEQVETRERMAALAEAMAGLPETQRRVAELLLAGFRQFEIAEELGITRGGVGMAIIRMRGRLDAQ